MNSARPNRSQVLMLLFGGILPVVAFAIVEERYGVVWGTIAGMIFGVAELLYEKIRLGKVNGITWFSNALILVLGAISLISKDGVWFRLQPALLLACFGLAMLGSNIIGKPLLVAMAVKQRPDIPPERLMILKNLNLRVSVLLLILAGVSVDAALRWSVEAWAFLKGFGVTIIMVAYFGLEVVWARAKNK
ncbi:MAG: intracellular septation protein, partial [Proteobacteria bacterium]